MKLFPTIPAKFADLTDEAIAKFVTDSAEAIKRVTAAPSEFVSEDVSAADLLSAVREQLSAVADAKAVLSERHDETPEEGADDGDADEGDEATASLSDDELAEFAALATEVPEEGAEDEGDKDDGGEAADEAVTAATVPAARAKPARRTLPRPTRERQMVESDDQQLVPLVAAAGASGVEPGTAFEDMDAVAAAMQARRRNFGIIPEGTAGEKIPVVRARWADLYPADRKLSGDFFGNLDTITAALDTRTMRKELERRREGNLVASGGLCAPVQPYYNLQMVSQAMRPVRAALPAFNAERGGIRFARPATLAAVTTGVGVRTAAQDEAGGTNATKTCQVIDCPGFEEVDVQIIYHCLQFGNLGARTFPELLTQWNNLTLAAHARLAETELLTGIDTASEQVTASDLGLGASATLFSQIATAAAAMRSRHRMDPEAVLRILLPWWSVYLIVSDVFRGQFQRWEVDQARVVALLRSLDVEPSFYIDGASGRSQVFGTQPDGSLLPFPTTVVWYLYPEGSFLFVDSGTLELGLVRDSVLNSTNDFQIFGETFENVAFIGVESMAVESTTCDSGTVSLPDNVACPITY